MTVEPEARGNEETFGNDLKRLEADVVLLKEKNKQNNGDGNSSSNYKKEKPTWICKCEDGTDRCDHCFKCGSAGALSILPEAIPEEIPATGKLRGYTKVWSRGARIMLSPHVRESKETMYRV